MDTCTTQGYTTHLSEVTKGLRHSATTNLTVRGSVVEDDSLARFLLSVGLHNNNQLVANSDSHAYFWLQNFYVSDTRY